MKKYLLASAAVIVGAALAVPAAADINITATVTYDKDVVVTETLDKEKRVTLTTVVVVDGFTAAESNAVENQRIGPGVEGGANTASYTSGALGNRLPAGDLVADITASVNRNFGITQFNQDVGWGTNQANVVSAAVGLFAFFAEANNSASQFIQGNAVTEVGRVITDNGNGPARVTRSASILNSVLNNQGVTQVNQNAGIFNNQLNSVSLAIAFNPGAVALAEADLGQFNTGNATVETNTARRASITTSVNGNTGVTMGNQAAGHMANQGNLMSLSGAISWPAGAAGTTAFLNALPPLAF